MLEKSNWDETAAANEYFARQVQQNNRPRSAAAATPGYEDDINVRAPMQFQQERLIGGNEADENMGLLFTRRPQSAQVPQRSERFYRFIGDNLDTHLEARQGAEENEEESDDSESDDEEQKEGGQRRPLIKRIGGVIGNLFLKLWKGIVWLFDSNPQAAVRRESTLRQENSLEFNRIFNERINRLVNPQNQQVANPEFASLYTGPSFYKLCEDARRKRKPILILLLRSKTSKSQHNIILRNLLYPEHLRTTINTNFIVYGIYERPTADENLHRALTFPSQANIALFTLFVGHDASIQVASRLAGRREGDFSVSLVAQFLDENLQLYRLIAEEDPEYRRVSILQDAGLIPVTGNGLQPMQSPFAQFFGGGVDEPLGARPRTSSGALLDETRLLKERQKRELEEAQYLDQIKQLQQNQQEEEERRIQQEMEDREREEEEFKQAQQALEEAYAEQRQIKAQESQKILPPEPEANDPNACNIMIRLPGSGERVSRVFLKEHTVSVLYAFVDSLGDRVQWESGHTHPAYTIMQSMPRKEYKDKSRKLGEEGLFPRALLVIKEDD
ncbi:hypothetical protein FGO68_gene14995 [Halteria grandinella]|uniref:UBX domain-containing protein n=1 Tax=Halteria grandinella TaxID=5974 RepID=A0A8J8NYK8_HALGN|nr:hypothetical protein FGO68_gene14995 [Halteria grandinella]